MRTDPDVDPVTAWAEDVDAGRVVAGPHIRAAARRHLTDLEEAGKRGLVFDRAKALRAVTYFPRRFRLNGGQFEGRPFHLHPSQQFRIGSLFGWVNRDTKLRRFRRFYDEEGKGNGKSPMLAGIGLYGLVADGEPRAEIYAAASKKDQAMVLFKDGVAMVQQSPDLARRVRTHGVDPVWSLTYHGKAGDRREFRPISSEEGKSGPRPHMALVDEVHEHRNRDVIDMLERGFKFRRQPLLCMATNAGTDRKSVCFEEHTHAINVAHGRVEDDTTFAFVCSLDEGDDWELDPSCWGKPNPLLGSILSHQYLALQVDQAVKMPGKRNGIARLHFCEWTDAVTAAFKHQTWSACLGEADVDALIAAGYPCYGGLDLSQSRDFTAFTLTWVLDPTKDAERFVSKTWFWTPGDTLRERAAADKAPYEVWARDGFIEPVDGDRIRYAWVADAVQRICARARPREVAADQYGLERLREHMLDGGQSIPFVIHPQGFNRRVLETDKDLPEGEQEIYLWMPDSINKMEAAVLEGRIVIERNPMMTSCAAHTAYTQNRTGHRMLDKQKATGRIDGMVTLTMSIGVATCRTRAAPPPSVYETRGILML